MSLTALSPQAARQLVAQGALLVDIRAADEHARERIPGASHVPLDRVAAEALPRNGASVVIFHCRSGNRTQVHARDLAAGAGCEAYMLAGGIDAWKKAGLPVVTDASRPIEIQRQVQIAAGSLVALGAVLGATVSPWFHGLSGLVGAGLVFAGASGFCGMARLLAVMPWNRAMQRG